MMIIRRWPLANRERKGRHSDVESGHGTRGRLSHYWRTRKPVLRLRSWKAPSLCLRHSSNHQDITRLKNVLWQFWDLTLLFLPKFWKGRCDVDNFYILLHQDFEELEVEQLATASGSEQRILSCVNKTLIEWSVSKSESKRSFSFRWYLEEQGNYWLRRPPKLIIPQAVIVHSQF